MSANDFRFPDKMPENDEEYGKIWENMPGLSIRMVEKLEPCKHEKGDIFYYMNPYKKPENVCNALLHVLDLYTWRAALGFPSWESDDRSVFRIHCPSKKGTVWELTRLPGKPPGAQGR